MAGRSEIGNKEKGEASQTQLITKSPAFIWSTNYVTAAYFLKRIFFKRHTHENLKKDDDTYD